MMYLTSLFCICCTEMQETTRNTRRKRKIIIPIYDNNHVDVTSNLTEFDKSFKYFKRRCPPPDLSQLLDLNNPDTWEQHKIEQVPLCAIDEDSAQSMGLKSIPSISLLKFIDKPGLLYIPNPFTPDGQQRWVLCCLREYTCSPTHKLNLDVHPYWRQESGQWWDLYCRNNEQCISLRKMLRWSTLGYHHNWDTKVYSEDNKGVFPPDLAQLSQLLVQAAGFSAYQAEAAIVNFYPMDSTLAGHTDHSEQDHTAPLLSLSFGQSAIFLIGGADKNEQPLALHVQSGDVVIMSGASRLSYHGVPRILPTSQNQSWGADQANDPDWIHCHRYLCNCRINLNIRQVLPFGNKSLHTVS